MHWLDALLAHTTPAVLVTVLDAQGSVPRHAGARMLVTDAASIDTIGGGHLELEAINAARAMLAAGIAQREERFPLGPRLGQCCGGSVLLGFETVMPGDVIRRAALQQEATAQRAHWPHLALFGAGHVGSALVRALADLPCRVTWVDVRDAQFPSAVPANVSIECTDTPEAVIAQAPAGTTFLVMTHSHALDEGLIEAILRRPLVNGKNEWCGLIGSQTKRVAFERRLRERGVAEERLTAMVCPIGLPGIRGKEPPVIAIAVCAQLLQLWEAENHD